MSELDDKDRPKFFLICIAVLALSYLAGNWATTQLIADALDYHELLPGRIYGYVFQPFAVDVWRSNAPLYDAIQNTIRQYFYVAWLVYGFGLFVCVQIYRGMVCMSSHGTADFAKAADIRKAGLSAKETGFVVGRNPFNDKMMLHNGPEHVLLVAPTRSGKGVCNMVPTGICWKHSLFLFDPKGELWTFTAAWRKKYLGQKVMKFEPLCKDGSSAKWNPFAEIDFQSFEELTDVSTISEMMVKTGEGGSSKDPFWENSAVALINGIILHLLYKHHQEKRLLPCPSDVMTCLSSPSMSTKKLFAGMKMHPHISKEEFLEEVTEIIRDEKGNPILDKNGKQQTRTKRYKNPLREIYGEYIEDFRPFGKACPEFAKAVEQNEEQARRYEAALASGKTGIAPPQSNLELLRRTVCALASHPDVTKRRTFNFAAPDISAAEDKKEINKIIQEHVEKHGPWYRLLVHPKVAEAAANMYNGADQTAASIMQMAQTAMAVYQDPLIRQNTAVSDFTLRDLLDPSQEVSLYLVLQPNDIDKLRPVLRLFVNTMLAKLVRDMEFARKQDAQTVRQKPKKQRLLLMLDEFPQLGKLESIEKSLAICAGYGVKICIVAQSMGQLNKIYTKDNAIPGNCHVQIYFTPTLEDEGGTAKTLSDTLGDKTIHSYSKSTSEKMFGGSTSTSNMARKLMTPDEVRRMPADRELVFVAGFRPVYGKKIRYYEEPYFMERIMDPPLFSDTATQIRSFAQLFAVHAAERRKIEERQEAVAAARTQAEQSAAQPRAEDTVTEPAQKDAKAGDTNVSPHMPDAQRETEVCNNIEAQKETVQERPQEMTAAERRASYLTQCHAAVLAWAAAEARKGA